MNKLVTNQAVPMMVLEYTKFRDNHTQIPRSSDGVTRKKKPSDIAVFVSHRWWDPDTGEGLGFAEPDDSRRTKYHLLVRGIAELIAAQRELVQRTRRARALEEGE